jgi:thiamine kinase-like enzyme
MDKTFIETHRLLGKRTLSRPCSEKASVPVIEKPSQITVDWLMLALRQYDPRLPNINTISTTSLLITEFEVVVSVVIQYIGGAAVPRNLLCKISTPSLSAYWDHFISDVCVRETSAHSELAFHNACRVPRMYFSASDGRTINLLIEDNGSKPGFFPTQSSTVVAHVDAAIRELALLHGCFARQSPVSAPNWLIRPRQAATTIAQWYQAGLKRLLCSVGDRFPEKHKNIMQTFERYIVVWHEYEKHLLTVTHGDTRSENIWLAQVGGRYRITLLGWKLAGIRNPMFDIACLIVNTLTEQDRLTTENELLERYRRVFEQSGVAYSMSDANNDYEFNLFAPLIFNICSIAFLRKITEEHSALIRKIRRNCHAIEHREAASVLKQRLR